MTCPQCNGTVFEPGFIEDAGQNSRGFARWIQGALERGPLGNAKRFGRPHWTIEAWRCTTCARLELYARTQS